MPDSGRASLDFGAIPVAQRDHERAKKLTFGILLVFAIAISQVGASQFAKSTYQPGFNAPFFITWFNAVWLIICYPVYLLCSALNCWRKESLREKWRRSTLVFGEKGLSLKAWILRGGLFSVLGMGTNYSYVRALGTSKPSDVTALFASNSAFVFLLSCALLGAQILSLKILSVCLAVAGIVLIAYSDGFSGPTLNGVLLSILAAFGAATYIVLFKRILGNAKPEQVSLFLSGVASFTLLVLWPIILILHFTEVEVITSNVPWVFMAGSCSLGLVFNFLINYGTAYTYPLFIAFGGIVGVPLNHIADWLFRSNQFDSVKIAGTVLIIAAFIWIVTLPAHIDESFHRWLTTCAKKGRRTPEPSQPEETEQLNRTDTELLERKRTPDILVVDDIRAGDNKHAKGSGAT